MVFKEPLMQLHGSLMVIAWLMAASVGILMPRYLRDGFKGRKLMGKDLWFVVSHFYLNWFLIYVSN